MDIKSRKEVRNRVASVTFEDRIDQVPLKDDRCGTIDPEVPQIEVTRGNLERKVEESLPIQIIVAILPYRNTPFISHVRQPHGMDFQSGEAG